MIFIKTNEKEEVVYQNFMPLDEVFGLGKTEEELKIEGFLVDAIPSFHSQAPGGYTLKYDGTNFYFEERSLSIEESKLDYFNSFFKSKVEIFNELPSTSDFETFKNAKIDALKEQCTNAIHEGFESSTIGKSFGFNEHDQANFTQQLLIIVAAGGNYTAPIKWKALDGSVNELTSEQFQVLIGEASAHKISNQEKFWALEQQLLAATTKEEIIAIEW